MEKAVKILRKAILLGLVIDGGIIYGQWKYLKGKSDAYKDCGDMLRKSIDDLKEKYPDLMKDL
jgi:hypothetical protein